MLGFLTALQSLWTFRRRTFLSGLGMTVGVCSIVLLISLALGVQQDVAKQVADLGVNLVIVLPGRLSPDNPFNPMSIIGLSTLHENDVEVLRQLPGVQRVAPIMFVAGGASHKSNRADAAIILATTPEWFQIRRIHLQEGRLFTSEELNGNVCLLSSNPAQQLFGDSSPIDQYVELTRKSFRVLGVIKENPEISMFGSGGFEFVIYTPIEAMQKAAGSKQIHRIIVQTQPDTPPETLVARIKAAVLANHGGSEDFSVVTQKQLLDLTYQVLNILTVMLTGITSIALIVGGIGVMNVMLMSVTERVREIGIRKTVGARRANIFFQFLLEALMIALIGGILGVLLAYVICVILNEHTVLNPLVTWNTILLALGVCGLVGVLFGTVPALRAASKDPVESLRYE